MQCCPNKLIYIKTNFFLHLDVNSLLVNMTWENPISFLLWNKIIQKIMSETNIEQLPISYIEAVLGRCSSKKDVLKNFANFTGKYLCWSLFLAKFSRTLLKKHSNISVFLWNLRNLKKNIFYWKPPVAASPCNVVRIS